MKKLYFTVLLFIVSISLISLQDLKANNSNTILITEIGNHEITSQEWIEIYNTSNQNFDLSNLVFRERDINHKTAIVQGSNILPPQTFALIVNDYTKFIQKYPEHISSSKIIIDSTWRALPDDGHLLELYKDGELIEQINYTENHSDTSLERLHNNHVYSNEWASHPENNSMFQHSTTETNNTEFEGNNPDTSDQDEQNTNTQNDDEDQEDTESHNDEDNDTDVINSTITVSDPSDDENDNTDTTEENNDQSTDPNSEFIPDDEPTIIYQDIIHYIELPFILISEVSFNSSPDWIEIFIDPRNSEVTLNNLELEVNNKKHNLGLSGKIDTPSVIVVDFNLVATTELISILYNGQVYDSLCWINSAPAAGKLLNIEILQTNQYWKGDCLDSTLIKPNYTFFRPQLIPDTNTKHDFQVTQKPTRGSIELEIEPDLPPIAQIDIQNQLKSLTAPVSINLDGRNSTDPSNDTLTYLWEYPDQIINTSNPNSVQLTEPGLNTITLTVTNSKGLSSSAQLSLWLDEAPIKQSSTSNTNTNSSSNSATTKSEVALASTTTDQKNSKPPTDKISILSFMPNPKGVDTDFEYIEIINLDDKDIDLTGYYLDDEEGGSKPYPLSGTIKSKEAIKYFSSETKISLGNTRDHVRLLFNGTVLQQIEYENAKDNEIFKKINTDWTRFIEDATTPTQDSVSQANTENTVKIDTISSKIQSITTTNNGDLSSKIWINEVFPNPVGVDTGKEWIELHNQDSKPINLNNWKIKIGKSLFTITDKTVQPDEYIVIQSEKLKIPNSNTRIELLDFSNKLISVFEFDKSYEGQSVFMWQAGRLIWTDQITPGKENIDIFNFEGTVTEQDMTNQTITLQGHKLDPSEPIDFQAYFTAKQAHLFKPNTKVKLIIIANIDNPIFSIYEITSTTPPLPDKKSNKKNILWTLLIPLTGIPAIIYRKKLLEIINYVSNLQ